MSDHTLRYLSRADVESLSIPMKEIIDAVEGAFLEKGEGTAEMPPKPGVHPLPDAFIHAMPAYLAKAGGAGMKWVAGFPENLKRDLPYISGLFILNDVETGFPLSVMDCTWITGMRTGAATGVAAKYLARPESSTVGIVACGLQGRTNLEALSCLFSLERVHAFDTNPQAVVAFKREMEEKLGLEIVPVDRAEDAVRGMDLVVTSGPILKDPTPVIPAGWLEEGSFACPLDFDSYWKGDALAQIDRLATDDRGQLDYYRTVGYFGDTPDPHADLGQIVAGSVPGRESPQERTLSMNLGLAIEDVASALIIFRKAVEMGIGVELPL
jgi:ornithine cyclodeaminase/alanine dehydrogenase-like protein (mu-crystallin family)